MLLHYLWKLKLLIASTFVIHPQILIFSMFEIINRSQYCIANKIFHVTVLLLIYFGDQLWHQKFVIADASLHCLSTINMISSDEHKILIQSLYLKGYTAKRLTDEFPEKSWTMRFKKLRDTGRVNRRPGNGRPRSARTEDKNSSGDEIANVNFYAVSPGSYLNFVEIAQNNGHYAVQGHSRSTISVPIESSYAISY